MTTIAKKRLYSGVKPSGDFHLGNYIGAVSQWLEMQNNYDSIFCVVDYHAITVPQDPEKLRARVLEVARFYLASGIDPLKSIVYRQSDVPAHVELCWIFNTILKMSDLFKMTQFKDKTGIYDDALTDNTVYNQERSSYRDELLSLTRLISDGGLSGHEAAVAIMNLSDKHNFGPHSLSHFLEIKNALNKAGVGLFDYPALMAADILLYDTEVVPVGEDQVQHVELARELARRFNHRFGETFKLPQAVLKKEGARIMALDNPSKKMSKSESCPSSSIAMLESPDEAAKKIKRAVTDSGSEIYFNQKDKPAISNLLTIFSCLSGKSIKDLEKAYANSNYGAFKTDLAGVVKDVLLDFRARYDAFDESQVRAVLTHGAEQASAIATPILKTAKQRIGLD